MAHSYKLFVDDMREVPAGWIGCRTVSEAIALLATLPIEEVSLDHDIIFPRHGAGLYQALCQETFKGVAYYIAAMPADVRPKKIRIHTANAGAGMTMAGILGLDFKDVYSHYQPENYK